MKHLLGISLFFILAAPFFVPYTLLRHEKNQIRKAVKKQLIEGVQQSELVSLKFSKQETQTVLRWEHAKEFEYKNEMYDVVEAKPCGDSIEYICWWDHAETELNKQLTTCLEDVMGKNSERKKKEKDISNFFELLYYHHTFSWQMAPFYLESKLSALFLMRNYSIYFSPSVPPPESIV